MAKSKETIFEWTDANTKKHQFSIEQIESLFYKNKDSLVYKLAQTASVLKRIFNFFGGKTELEEEKDISVIKEKLKKQNINLNEAKNSGGDNILLFYVKNNKKEEIAKLITLDANINQPNKDGNTALHEAVKAGKHAMVQSLINFGANVNQQNKDGNIVLHIVAKEGKENKDGNRIAKLLIENGADPSIKNKDGNTALHILAQGEDNDNEQQKRRIEIMELLLNKNKDIINLQNKLGDTALHIAAQIYRENIIILQHLIDRGSNLDTKNELGNTALHTAITKDPKNIQLLLDMGADVNAQNNLGDTALHIASTKSQPHKVKLLLENGADVDKKNNEKGTALFYAASKICQLYNHSWFMHEDERAVMKLLYETGDQEHKAKAIKTVFDIRLQRQHTTRVQPSANFLKAFELIGVTQINMKSGAHIFPTQSDVKASSPAKTQARPEIKKDSGNSIVKALHKAIRVEPCDLETLENLIKTNKDIIDQKNSQGDTALHIAVKLNKEDAVNLLINKNAKIDIKDKNGKTALDIAADKGNKEIVALLKGENARSINQDIKGVQSPPTSGKNLQWVQAKLPQTHTPRTKNVTQTPRTPNNRPGPSR